ncbi:MAG: chemotaxis-specific protein-glutamate methyltransferase CheB [Polyangiaceae bacterium]|nr:chemotaxis-specific protein-glutamate methyltransferase CheB [Polyangiaceae bacterium]
MTADKPLRLLIVDDSAYNRRLIQGLFAGRSDVTVVGAAADGEEAIRLSSSLEPDVITLDLEMPKMDGFTALRILLAKRQVPIIVVSSYAQRENVFKALELGAIDFVTKATSTIDANAEDLKREILQKVLAVRGAPFRADSRRPSQRRLSDDSGRLPSSEMKVAVAVVPKRVIVIASSTGGPTALLELVGALPKDFPHALLVAQHMPEKFTRTFAERLGRRGALRGAEAEDRMRVHAASVLVCPGGYSMEILRDAGELFVRVARPLPSDRYVPSGDRLLSSAAVAFGKDAVGVVLTGMGDDGLVGARRIREAGGLIVAEAEETAVVYGMPGAVVAEKLANLELPLPKIADFLATLR